MRATAHGGDDIVGPDGPGSPELAHAGTERFEVACGLEAERVVGEERAHQLAVYRQRAQHLDVWERNVQEESQPLPYAGRSQLLTKRNQVIVVHPDEIVIAQQGKQPVCEQPVDPLVRGVLRVDELEFVGEIVKERPERPVAEADVMQLVIFASKIGGCETDSPTAREPRLARCAVHHFAAPAEPEPAAGLHGRQYADSEPAGCGALAWQRDPIRHCDEAAHTRSSQLRLRRTAELTIPTML